MGHGTGHSDWRVTQVAEQAEFVASSATMAITTRSRLLIPALLALALAPAPKAMIAYQRAPGHGYWTRYRMTHAIPMDARSTTQPPDDGSPWSGGGPIARDTGKIFFTLDGSNYVCSGAVLATPARTTSVVATAAHCVTDGSGDWATNWTFVPDYSDGSAPYGSYDAQTFFVSPRWNQGMDESYDVAFTPIRGLSGGLPVEFGKIPRSAYVFGYPTEPPYDGGSLIYCDGRVTTDPTEPKADVGLPCSMTAGDSGGPWLSGFDPSTRTGTVFGVSAFKYSDNDQVLYGTTFGAAAHKLYDEAAASS